ncbi:MAG TPA: hypothetical protein VF944_04435 [Candidatus Bathyarchaeia archaeon]
MAIHNDLVEAYKGFYEDEIARDEPVGGEFYNLVDEWVEAKIRSHTPKERLEVYLEWNGIIGYTGRIWSIAQGEFES